MLIVRHTYSLLILTLWPRVTLTMFNGGLVLRGLHRSGVLHWLSCSSSGLEKCFGILIQSSVLFEEALGGGGVVWLMNDAGLCLAPKCWISSTLEGDLEPPFIGL